MAWPEAPIAQTTGPVSRLGESYVLLTVLSRITLFLSSLPSESAMIFITSLRARVVALAIFGFCVFAYIGHLSPLYEQRPQGRQASGAVLKGPAIAPRLGNATAK